MGSRSRYLLRFTSNLGNLGMSSIRDYLVWEPTGQLKNVANSIDDLQSSSTELYRGISKKELDTLNKNGSVQSLGKGNTRDVTGSYLASDIKLAGRFGLVALRDTGNGYILVLDKGSIPDLKQVDPGNFVGSVIPISSVKKIIDLSKMKTTNQSKKENDRTKIHERKMFGIESVVASVLGESKMGERQAELEEMAQDVAFKVLEESLAFIIASHRKLMNSFDTRSDASFQKLGQDISDYEETIQAIQSFDRDISAGLEGLDGPGPQKIISSSTKKMALTLGQALTEV